MNNIILNSDSYKYSQWNQYPPNTEYIYSYIESRGGVYDETVFFGLQAFVKEYLTTPITMEMIDEAEAIILAHGEPFNREGWEYILERYDGYLPVTIKAAPEGKVIPVKNVLATITNMDPKCYWLTSFLETAILRAIWYPTTVATNSREIKKVIKSYLEKTGDPATIDFKLHDFGARGVSSFESAGLGGMAHLVNFQGTDTVTALLYARRYYGADMAGFSIPAMEHSTVTSWGQVREVDSYRNMLDQYAKPGALLAAVSDSYDIYEACRLWGTELKQQIIDSGATLVVRPDSGDPVTVIRDCIEILGEHFGYTVNEKGYKVLNNVRMLQGDGINIVSVEDILDQLERRGWSADNIAFGMGGALLQIVNRDDQKFAMKTSAIYDGGFGEWFDVFKDPITDPGKQSKKGQMVLIETENGLKTVTTENDEYDDVKDQDILEVVYSMGKLIREMPFNEVRANASL